jgi:hypothetical protein
VLEKNPSCGTTSVVILNQKSLLKMCVATFFHCPDCLRTYDIPFLNPAVVFKNTSVVFDYLCSNQTCGRLSEIAIRDHLPYTTSFLHNSTCGSPGCTLAVCNSSFIFRRCSDTSLNIRRIVRVADEFDAGPAYFFPPSCARHPEGLQLQPTSSP